MTDVDVVVAGAGGAGLAAALRAAEAGCSVLVAEAKPTFRVAANTVMSTAMVPAGGSRWQRRARIDDSPRRFLDDVIRKSKGSANRQVAETLTTVAPDLVTWLADSCGVPLELVTDFEYPGHSAYRCHTVPDRAGATLHRHMLEAAEKLDNVVLLAPRRVMKFEAGESHSTHGIVTIERPDRTSELVTTRALVLATCGFGANRALVEKYVPEIADALYFGSDGSTGDGLALGVSLGADVDCLDAYQGHGSVAVPHGILVTWAVVMHGGFIFNKLGRRFGDESVGYSEYARAVRMQPAGEAWMLLDRRIDEACRSFADYQRLLGSGAVRWADHLEEVANATGVAPFALERTTQLAALAATGAEADEHGRTHWEHVLESPYGFVRVGAALFHTQGGLAVDHEARVLRHGSPIPGLFAAGGAAVGMSGRGASGYLAGNGLLGALGLGYVAGRTIANERSK